MCTAPSVFLAELSQFDDFLTSCFTLQNALLGISNFDEGQSVIPLSTVSRTLKPLMLLVASDLQAILSWIRNF